MHSTFTNEPLHIDDVVVYLKNERTGSSTIRKCKLIGQIIDFTDTKVKIRRLSPPDKFVTPDECKDFGLDTVYPNDVVYVIISRYQLDNWLVLPCTIGDITFYDKKELIEWVQNQQALNKEATESYNRLVDEINGIHVVNPTF